MRRSWHRLTCAFISVAAFAEGACSSEPLTIGRLKDSADAGRSNAAPGQPETSSPEAIPSTGAHASGGTTGRVPTSACEGAACAGAPLTPEQSALCGDGVVDQDIEECDDGNRTPGDGCDSGCKVEPKAECPPQGGACQLAVCGDGVREGLEDCDDGNLKAGDGCSPQCTLEASCPDHTGACTSTAQCGDGILGDHEVCDDANRVSGDGCLSDCSAVEPGFTCRRSGTPCTAICGDGLIVQGIEECDDGNRVNADGCSSTCAVAPGYTCTGEPSVCTATTCGDGVVEGDEQCDLGDANGLFYGDGTGCSTACTHEPLCRDPSGGPTHACDAVCGDGVIVGDEDCDDGNLHNGDGCSAECRLEAGHECTTVMQAPTQPCDEASGECLVLPLIVRDFKGQEEPDGHPDFFYYGATGIDGQRTCCVPNAVCDPEDSDCLDPENDATPWCEGLVASRLDDQGRPVLDAAGGSMCECQFTDRDDTGILDGCPGVVTVDGHQRIEGPVRVIESASSFAQWFSPSHPADAGGRTTLELHRNGSVYLFSSSDGRTIIDDLHEGTPVTAGFFPVDDLSSSEKLCNLWGYWVEWPNCEGMQWDLLAGNGAGAWVEAEGTRHNFYFTTEARMVFVYRGGEQIRFYGDDDTWIFINGALAADAGGTHSQIESRVTLSDNGDERFGLELGLAYELVIFQANRHPRESNYQLALGGFETARSVCAPVCGDGVKTATEECDDGPANSDTAYGGCRTDCTFGPFCGDGKVDSPEECDDGNTASGDGCSPVCQQEERR